MGLETAPPRLRALEMVKRLVVIAIADNADSIEELCLSLELCAYNVFEYCCEAQQLWFWEALNSFCEESV